MRKNRIGIFLSLLLLVGFTACTETKSNSKLVINEVLVDNQSNFQDDYGVHSGWIEIFNRAYSTADLAGCLLKVSSEPGDTATYFIPKGDVLTSIKPRQHTLFWADGNPRRGTFHTNFVLSKTNANWIGLYDSGKKLLDQIGIGMAISAMSVVFLGLILLYICFKLIGKAAIKLRKRNAMIAHNITDKQEAKEKGLGEAPGEVIAAITMALHEAQGADHDVEETILTISRVKRSYSPWSSKIYTLRETPHKK